MTKIDEYKIFDRHTILFNDYVATGKLPLSL